MKVVLRNPHTSDGRDLRHSLTVGAEYEVLGIECDSFRLLTDDGEPVLFDPACFDIVDRAEPIFWKSSFGVEGERYAYPPGWDVPGFFEAWHDRNELVREVFVEQLAYWFPAARRAD